MSKDTKKKLRYEMWYYKRYGKKYKQLELTDSKEKKKKKKDKKGITMLITRSKSCPNRDKVVKEMMDKKPLNKKET